MAKHYANFHNLALESFCYILTKVVWHIMAICFLQPAPLMCGLHIIHLIHELTFTTHALSTVNWHAVRQSIPHENRQPYYVYNTVGLPAYACDTVISPGHHRGTPLYYLFYYFILIMGQHLGNMGLLLGKIQEIKEECLFYYLTHFSSICPTKFLRFPQCNLQTCLL